MLSAAMDEITRELAPGSVDVRLRGLDPDFVVTPPPRDAPPPLSMQRSWTGQKSSRLGPCSRRPG
ncbi:hypothetical protein [Streptomyces sp. bgisy031]|uniref:hypothetical protein n=1 Tax=Streptomyces sp. bgisy031 TaxID=3413772 RepID=UPI003D728153